jgi:hypothetical protein
MDLVLTLAAIASFFALVLAWTVLPPTSVTATSEAAQPTASSTQAAH